MRGGVRLRARAAGADAGGALSTRAEAPPDRRAPARVPDARPLARRFLEYQRERFPLAAYVPLIAVFTFSAAAYSRLARGAPGFVPADRFFAGALTALVFFFMLRVLDEHKDAEVDRRYRPELPVPRGLVSLAELRRIGGAALAGVLFLNALLAPVLLWACLAVALWAALMTREFFVPGWLRAHPAAYLVTHMAIMPMIDGYTTGLDWLAEGADPPRGLWLFLLVTFLNGVVIEIGRKIRAPEGEREGVDTYTRVWGTRTAPAVWLATLAATAATAWLAARHVGIGGAAAVALAIAATLAALPALLFLRAPGAARAKRIEAASGAWTLAMYLLLGAGPFLARWIGGGLVR
ncbi:MAG TPA: UbiA family prenyltransferase [Longimicrobiaceae bacterium]|nr:UbiA family prenyltransferase [Longimicrobiaceae bacterium]